MLSHVNSIDYIDSPKFPAFVLKYINIYTTKCRFYDRYINRGVTKCNLLLIKFVSHM